MYRISKVTLIKIYLTFISSWYGVLGAYVLLPSLRQLPNWPVWGIFILVVPDYFIKSAANVGSSIPFILATTAIILGFIGFVSILIIEKMNWLIWVWYSLSILAMITFIFNVYDFVTDKTTYEDWSLFYGYGHLILNITIASSFLFATVFLHQYLKKKA